MNKRELIQKIRSLNDITAEEKAYLIELVNTKKKYGLVWEDKPEDVEEQLRSMLPVFKEVKERAIISEDKEAPNHILIEGDNLHALTALTYTHEGKIDVIYIDPPYNTGNKDFKYNDSFVDKEDSYRHSKWLSFMEKRLRIAKQLLTESGVIFISIDENECYQLKLLCDEIFDQKNFVADNIWKSKSGGAGDATHIAVDTENILVYAKDKEQLILGNDMEATVTTSYNRVEPDGRKYSLERLDKQSIRYSQSLDFTITDKEGNQYKPNHKDPKNPNATWRWSKQKIKENFDDLVFENGKVYTKNYQSLDGSKPRNLLNEERFGRTRTGKTELFSIIGANNMTAPKPSRLIQYLINLFPEKDFIFLDFFAGSGTSLDALITLNSIDNGNRQGIICTNNEDNICENITYPRLTNIIKGYISQGNNTTELFLKKITLSNLKNYEKLSKKLEKIKKEQKERYNSFKVEFKEGNLILWGIHSKNKDIKGLSKNNLRYFKADFVPSQKTEKNRRLLTARSTDLLCIKEDCFLNHTKDFGLDKKQAQIFTNGLGKYMVVIYYTRNQEEIIEQLNDIITNLETEEKVRVYAFSPEKELIEDDLFKVADKIEAVPLPDSIYNAFRATFRTLKLDKKEAVGSNQEK